MVSKRGIRIKNLSIIVPAWNEEERWKDISEYVTKTGGYWR